MNNQTIASALKSLKERLFPVAGECSQSEAERILQHILQCSRSNLYISSKSLISTEQENLIQAILQRRLTREPLPYILGSAYFHSREFIVSRDVLIPRPETEVLVETILQNEKGREGFFLDVGIGSGAISAVLVQERPAWKAVGVDVSPAALKIAKRNCPGNVLLCACDALSALKPSALFDFIVSNPPYISVDEMHSLDASVRDFEPANALYGGKDGLDFYCIIAESAKTHLKAQGRIYCEIGCSQAEAVKNIFAQAGWKNVSVKIDLAGRPRVFQAAI